MKGKVLFKCLECGAELKRNEVYKNGKYYSCISCLGVAKPKDPLAWVGGNY